MNKLLKCLLAVLLFIILIGCSHITTKQELISKQEAEKIAKEQFSQLNYGPIKKYKLKITDEHDPSKWSCFFDGVDEYARPGYHVIIEVSKESGAVTIMHGE